MYASIRRYATDSSAEVTRRVQEGFVPLLSNTAGFIAYYAIDTGKGEWVSLSLFETRAQVEQSNDLAAAWRNVALLLGEPEVIAGEVVVSKAK
jgi:hypothetical protein